MRIRKTIVSQLLPCKAKPVPDRSEPLASMKDLEGVANLICDQADRKAGIKPPPRK